MTTYKFDTVINRLGTDSAKWNWFDPDVLPLWVADMDFASPEPVLRALEERVRHGIFGYMMNSPELRHVICERMARLYGWSVQPDEIVFVPRLITGLSLALRAYGQPGDNALMQTPVYMPFLSIPADHQQTARIAQLSAQESNGRLRYDIDFDVFEQAIDAGTKVFMLCNPHNPVGRVWTRAELERMAEICLKHDVIICSDEIHCDLLYDGSRHIPIAALSPEVAARTVTLMAPTKTFNLPGIGCAFTIIQDAALRQRYNKAIDSLGTHISVFGFTAGIAAYQDGGEWLDQLLPYLQANRDTALDFIDTYMPDVKATNPEGTFLLWMDTRAVTPPDTIPAGADWIATAIDPFFLKQARVALNRGGTFGAGGEGFVRLNFGCPRSTLMAALERMRAAIHDRV